MDKHEHDFKFIKETAATESHYMCDCGVIKYSKEYWYEIFKKEQGDIIFQKEYNGFLDLDDDLTSDIFEVLGGPNSSNKFKGKYNVIIIYKEE